MFERLRVESDSDLTNSRAIRDLPDRVQEISFLQTVFVQCQYADSLVADVVDSEMCAV